jgi:hypothetical protein
LTAVYPILKIKKHIIIILGKYDVGYKLYLGSLAHFVKIFSFFAYNIHNYTFLLINKGTTIFLMLKYMARHTAVVNY